MPARRQEQRSNPSRAQSRSYNIIGPNAAYMPYFPFLSRTGGGSFHSTHGRACLMKSLLSLVILNSTSMAKPGSDQAL